MILNVDDQEAALIRHALDHLRDAVELIHIDTYRMDVEFQKRPVVDAISDLYTKVCGG